MTLFEDHRLSGETGEASSVNDQEATSARMPMVPLGAHASNTSGSPMAVSALSHFSIIAYALRIPNQNHNETPFYLHKIKMKKK